jgi:integrase
LRSTADKLPTRRQLGTPGGGIVTTGNPHAGRANLSSKRVVDALQPRAAPFRVFDERLPGFGVHVAVTGRKSYVCEYRAKGVSRRMFLGRTNVLTPAEARTQAMEALAAVAKGRDPLAERRVANADGRDAARARRAAPTVADAAGDYLATLGRTRSARWAADARALYDAHIGPKIGTRKVADVTAKDVRQIHERLRDTPVTANRTRAVLSAILTRAVADGARAPGVNPVVAVEAYPEEPRSRYLNTDEWKRLGEAVTAESAALATVKRWDTRPRQLDAVVLLALTGARKNAVTRRRWRDVDWEARVLTIDPPHKGTSRVHLGAAALALLRAWQGARGTGDGYIFAGQRRHDGPRPTNRQHDPRPVLPPTYVSTLALVWRSLMTRAKLTDFHVHDLRRSFAVAAGDIGISTHLIGGLLSHAVGGVTGIYARRSDPALADAANKVAAEVARRLNLKGTRDRSVIPIDAGRRRA